MTLQTTLSGPSDYCYSQDPTCCVDFSYRQKSTFLNNWGFEAGGAGSQPVGQLHLGSSKASKRLAWAWLHRGWEGVRGWGRVVCKHRVQQGALRGGAAPARGLRVNSSLFTDTWLRSVVLVPTRTLLQLESRVEGKDIKYLSFQLLLFCECLWPSVRGPTAVPKAGGIGAS